jgi:hypothetical protein
LAALGIEQMSLIGIPEGLYELFEAVEHYERRDDMDWFDRVGELIAEMFPELNARDAYTLREMLLMQAQYTQHQLENVS